MHRIPRGAAAHAMLAAVALVLPSPSHADPWKLAANTGLSMTQATYNTAWSGSEQGSINWVATGLLTADRQLSAKVNWSNKVDLAFGQTYTQVRTSGASSDWLPAQKSTDKIRWDAVFRFTLGAYVVPFAAHVLETQFLDKRPPLVAVAASDSGNHYFNPIRLTQSAGVARVVYHGEGAEGGKDAAVREVLTRAGFAFREKFTSLPGAQDTRDGGLEWVTDARGPFFGPGLDVNSKLTVFKALVNSESDKLPTDDWKTIDVNWENTINAKVAKYVSVSLYFQMIYDKEESLSAQIKETLGLGLTYTLF